MRPLPSNSMTRRADDVGIGRDELHAVAGRQHEALRLLFRAARGVRRLRREVGCRGRRIAAAGCDESATLGGWCGSRRALGRSGRGLPGLRPDVGAEGQRQKEGDQPGNGETGSPRAIPEDSSLMTPSLVRRSLRFRPRYTTAPPGSVSIQTATVRFGAERQPRPLRRVRKVPTPKRFASSSSNVFATARNQSRRSRAHFVETPGN